MRQSAFLLLLTALTLAAEVHTMTLGEAVNRALERNPDLIIATLDEQKAARGVEVARDPFIPKVFAGSGLAYSSGFPLSVEGAAPSIVQVRGVASLIDRPRRYRLRESRAEAEQASISTEAQRDEVVFRTTALYLDAEFAARKARTVTAQVDSLTRVMEAVRQRVKEGRELPIEVKRAQLDVARARQRVQLLESDQEFAESSLAA
ncbi:MAG: TolC family protein, partial [bacterium]|nr:TolC family protein [bacterium]